MSLGTGEWIVFIIVIVIIFSASRMAALGNALGKFVYSFKKASRGDDFIDASASSRQKLGKPPVPEDAQLIEPPQPPENRRPQ